jgi:RNA polymerase sigma factor (sigma-70 family)
MQDSGPQAHSFGDAADSRRRVPVLRAADAVRIEEEVHSPVGRMVPSEPTAFWRLWEQYRPELYRCCLRWMGGDPHEAQAALSSVALKVVAVLSSQVEGITDPRAWLRCLTYHLCMDLHREHCRYAQILTRLADLEVINSDAGARGSEQPERVLLRQELGAQLQRAIAHLPLSLREPLLLRVVEGLPYRAIAAQLALTPANVRKRVQQARTRMRTELHAYLSADHGPRTFTH